MIRHEDVMMINTDSEGVTNHWRGHVRERRGSEAQSSARYEEAQQQEARSSSDNRRANKLVAERV
jgi:hypothetical protein